MPTKAEETCLISSIAMGVGSQIPINQARGGSGPRPDTDQSALYHCSDVNPMV